MKKKKYINHKKNQIHHQENRIIEMAIPNVG
jgi:hypothetical protein